jgi:hypothetical protein
MATVYASEGTTVTFDENTGVLWVGLSACPCNEAIDKMWTVLSTFVKLYPKRCILHLSHVETPTLEPPALATMVHIVSKVVNEFGDIGNKCRRIIVQPKYVDDKVLFAQSIFVNLINNKVPMRIISSPDEVESYIQKLLLRGD